MKLNRPRNAYVSPLETWSTESANLGFDKVTTDINVMKSWPKTGGKLDTQSCQLGLHHKLAANDKTILYLLAETWLFYGDYERWKDNKKESLIMGNDQGKQDASVRQNF